MKTPMQQMLEFLIKESGCSHAEKIAKAIELKAIEKKHIMMAAGRTMPDIIAEEVGEEYYNFIYQ